MAVMMPFCWYLASAVVATQKEACWAALTQSSWYEAPMSMPLSQHLNQRHLLAGCWLQTAATAEEWEVADWALAQCFCCFAARPRLLLCERLRKSCLLAG